MGRLTDQVNAAVTEELVAATAARGASREVRAPRDWRALPITLGMLVALGGAVGGVVSWTRSADETIRGTARETAVEHDRSGMAHTDMRARLARVEDRAESQIAELRERVRALEERLRMVTRSRP